MDDIGNILYILAMLAALVFSAYKKQKQSKRQQQPMPEEEHRPAYDPMDEDDVLTELKELFGKPKAEPKPVVEEAVVQKVEVKPKPLVIQDEKVSEKVKQEPIRLEVYDDEPEGFIFDKEQIDLRQAVIYSEILKRPYE